MTKFRLVKCLLSRNVFLRLLYKSVSISAVVTAFVYPQERELEDDLNVIIFSDHGMTDIFWMDKVIELNKYIDLNDLQQAKDRGPVVSLWPAPGKYSEARSTKKWGRGWVDGQGSGARPLSPPLCA